MFNRPYLDPTQSPLNGEPYILRLPDEIMHEIFAVASAPPENEWRHKHYECAAALSTVCQRFHDIVRRLLYHSIRFEYPCTIAPPCIPTRRFHKTCKACPSLRAYVKVLKIHMRDIPKIQSVRSYEIATEMLSWIPNVTSFKLHGGFGSNEARDTWSMICAR
jgi:hypothetical protein